MAIELKEYIGYKVKTKEDSAMACKKKSTGKKKK